MRVAQVRLVAAEAVDRLAVGQDREGRLQDGPLRDHGTSDLDGHLLHPGHHVRLGHEAHLEVQLGELRLPVATQVLVPEATRDLEVAVHARDHQQLLHLLRALGQRVDVARLEPRGHDEVPGALGRGLDEQRRLHLHEPRRVMGLPDLLDEPAAGQDALLERLPAKVEVAVRQAHRLVDVGVRLVDDEGRRPGAREDDDVRRAQLDRTRGQLRVLGSREPGRDACRGPGARTPSARWTPPRAPPGTPGHR